MITTNFEPIDIESLEHVSGGGEMSPGFQFELAKERAAQQKARHDQYAWPGNLPRDGA